MEPNICHGSIVLVKRTEELENDEIGIFVVDGDAVCKRYHKVGENVSLIPDNTSEEFKVISISSDTSCVTQGKVIDIHNA